MIYFCWAPSRTGPVSLSGWGITKCASNFVHAAAPEQACVAYREFLEAEGIRVRKVTGDHGLSAAGLDSVCFPGVDRVGWRNRLRRRVQSITLAGH